MSERIDRSDPVLAAIKKQAPHSLRVTLVDGESRDVAIPKAGNKWARLADALSSLQWERIECLDKDSKLLGGAIEREYEVDDEYDIADDDRDLKMLKLLMDCMRTTMRETRGMFAEQSKAQSDIMKAMSDSVHDMQTTYTTALQVQAAHLVAPDGQGGLDEKMLSMIGMAMMRPQARPVVAAPQPQPKPEVKP